VVQDAKAVEARLIALLGLGSRVAFESTARVSQRDLTQLRDGAGIADALAKLVTGGERDAQASRVLEELDRALLALRTTGASNPGPLAVLPGRIAAAESAAAARARALTRADQARAALAEIREALATARRELAQKDAAERDCAERIRLEDEVAAARRVEARLEERAELAVALAGSANRTERELQAYAGVLALSPDDVAEVAALEAVVAEAEETEPPEPSRAAPSAGWLAVGLALALVGLLGGLTFPPLYSLALVGAGLIVWALARVRPAGEAAALAARMRADERRDAADRATARLAELVAATGCATATELRARRRRGEELRRRAADDRARLDGLLAGQSPETVEAERREASRHARDLVERLDEPRLRLAKLDQSAYRRLVADVQALRARAEELGQREQDLRVAVLAGQVGVDEVHEHEEEAAELRAQLAAAEERQRVLQLTRDVLDEARAATMATAKDALEAELGGLVAEITGGRYRQVVVDPTRLSLRVLSPERGDLVGVSLDGDLSTGTVEQVYLAARLALTRLIAGGRRPLIILDDPFVTFDAARTRATLGLLRRLAREHQVLLFTCREEYREVADHVVVLPDVGRKT
jgi:uncharacterized protein YhaN